MTWFYLTNFTQHCCEPLKNKLSDNSKRVVGPEVSATGIGEVCCY